MTSLKDVRLASTIVTHLIDRAVLIIIAAGLLPGIRGLGAEELDRERLIFLLDDDRSRADLGDRPVGEHLAALQPEDLVRLIEPK